MPAPWLLNYYMVKRQGEVYHAFLCYEDGLVFEMPVCYGEGEVSQREVT